MPKIAKEFKWSNNQKSGVEYNDINEVQQLIKKLDDPVEVLDHWKYFSH